MIHLYPLGFTDAENVETHIKQIEKFLGKNHILVIPQALDRAAFFEQYLESCEKSSAILVLMGPKTAYWNHGTLPKNWFDRFDTLNKAKAIIVSVEESNLLLSEADLQGFWDEIGDFKVDYLIKQSTREQDLFVIATRLRSFIPNETTATERIQTAIRHQHSTLDLSRCEMEQLPSNFLDIAHQLETLNLAGNHFQYVPTELSTCSKLELLDLQDNPFSRVTGLGRLKNLRILNMRNTGLYDFPNEILECFQLEELDLSENPLSSLSSGIASLQKLRRLNLASNQLRQLPSQLAEMPSLQDILLHGNPLQTPPVEIALRGIPAIQAYFDDLTRGGVAGESKNWLLTVTISSYANGEKYRENNLEASKKLINVLRSKYGFRIASMLENKNAELKDINRGLQELANICGSNDNLILYFSVKTRENGSESDLVLYDRSIAFSQLIRPLNGFQVRHILIIIDGKFYSPLIEVSRNIKGFDEEFSSRWVLYERDDQSNGFTEVLVNQLANNQLEISVEDLTRLVTTTSASPLHISGDEGGRLLMKTLSQTPNYDLKEEQSERLKNLIANLRNLISKGETDKVFEAISENLTTPDNTIILLQGRWTRLKRSISNGTIGFNDENIEQNKLRSSLLSWLSELEPSDVIFKSTSDPSFSTSTIDLIQTEQITDQIKHIELLRTNLTSSTSTSQRRSLQSELRVAITELEYLRSQLNFENRRNDENLAEVLIQEEENWAKVLGENSIAGYENYLSNYPSSIYLGEVERRLNEIKLQSREESIVENIRQNPSVAEIQSYFISFPHGRYRYEIERIKQDLEADDEPLWAKAYEENSVVTYQQYLNETKVERHKTEALEGIKSLEQNQELKVNEAKLIIVGNGRVGKTSLTKVLIGDEPFDPQEISTHGVRIKKWDIPLSNGSILNLNVWDFGGQERYHNTHSFFLTKRALYLLVWDKDTEEDAKKNPNQPDLEAQNFDYEYWLDTIKARSENSPVIMAQNKIETGEMLLNQLEIVHYHPNICSFEEVSAAKKTNLNELRAIIQQQYQKAPGLKDLISFTMPAIWKQVRQELTELSATEPYISINKFEEICNRYNISNPKEFGVYLHDIGSILFFHEEDTDWLKDFVILNTVWATQVIYKVLNGKAKENHGRFNKSDLIIKPRAQGQPKYEEDGFYLQDRTEVEIFLDLMLSFKICFEISFDLPKTAKSYIVPQYLSSEIPPIVKAWPNIGTRKSGYRYSFLPRTVIAHAIARLSKFAENGHWWRDGLIINHNGASALIEADYVNKRIIISIQGESMDKLEDWIHEEHLIKLNEQLEATRVRFCPNCARTIDEESIIQRKKIGRKIIDCPCGNEIIIKSLYPTTVAKNPRIFISYAREDDSFRAQLDQSLQQLLWEGKLEIWDDSDLSGGDEWYPLIKEELTKADIIIFLLSVDFLTSKFIKEEELTLAFERHSRGELLIIPVIVRKCLWKSSPLKRFTIFPRGAKPLKSFDDPDEAWLEVTEKIREVLIKHFNWGENV